jgi:hypothetical protein
MDTSASTDTTIASLPREQGRASRAHQLVLTAVAVGAILAAVATVRLAAVTWATPADVWAEEYPPLLDASVSVDPGTLRFAKAVSHRVSDAALVRALGAVCFPGAQGGDALIAGEQGDPAACLAVIDEGLLAAPSNGELWFFKASTLAAEGEFGDPMMSALRNSFRTAPEEGWIAAGRVVLGLRLFPVLAPDLQEDVQADLRLVTSNSRLAKRLVDAYAGDGSLRAAAALPLRALPAEEMQRFVRMVRAAVRDQ